MALREWNTQGDNHLPIIAQSPEAANVKDTEKATSFLHSPRISSAYWSPGWLCEHTYTSRRGGSSFPGKHCKETHSASEDCSCLSHLTAFGSTLMGLAKPNLRVGSKAQLPSGLQPKDWHSSGLLAASPQGRCPGSLRGKADSWAHGVDGLASSQATASKTGWQGSLSGTRPDACCSFAAPPVIRTVAQAKQGTQVFSEIMSKCTVQYIFINQT